MARRSQGIGGAGTPGQRPVAGLGSANGPREAGQGAKPRIVRPSRTPLRSCQCAPVREYRARGQTHQGIEIHCGQVDTSGYGEGSGSWHDTIGAAHIESYFEALICTAPAGERDTDQLPESLAGALVDTDDVEIP